MCLAGSEDEPEDCVSARVKVKGERRQVIECERVNEQGFMTVKIELS